MKVNNIFETIQAEGKYAGYPMLFIRLSGCNKSCDFCDTKYHVDGKEMTVEQLVKKIKSSKLKYVVWTGGEPTLQKDNMYDVINQTTSKKHHLETNGSGNVNYGYFHYVCCSPKDTRDIEKFKTNIDLSSNVNYDIKLVTDTVLNKELIPFATMLMPLTTYTKRDKAINKDVWNYCINNNIRFCLRQHVVVWGDKRGV